MYHNLAESRVVADDLHFIWVQALWSFAWLSTTAVFERAVWLVNVLGAILVFKQPRSLARACTA